MIVSCSNTTDELVIRDGLRYTPFSTEPFTGVLKSYHDNGQPDEKVTYKDGKPVGVYKEYWENGQLERSATYKDGNLDGVLEQYDEDGKLILREEYKVGDLN